MRSAPRFLAALTLCAAWALPSAAQNQPSYLRDRGPGMRTSMFASYIDRGEILVYPFYEYYKDDNQQYSPNEYGGTGTQDFEGKYRANEGILFIGYGITDKLAVEMEMAYLSAKFEKDPLDTFGTPATLESSGIADIEGQITFRFLTETEKRPELYTFFEAVVPHDKTDPLLGTSDWELKLGVGGYRGFGFGTLQLSAAVEYTAASSTPWDLGETQLGYIRRVNPQWRVYAGIEGQATDEASLITEIQRTLSPNAYLKANLGVGLTSNAVDLAPEVGVMFSFPTAK